MARVSERFDSASVEWRRITEADHKDFRVDFEYSLLGYDLASGRLDMLLRYVNGGHCRPHRHVAATVTLVLEGEQILEERRPDGSIHSVRRSQGTYAQAPADALPHDEYGGPQGGTVLLSMTTGADGILFEYFDEDMRNPWTVSIDQYVESWYSNEPYGKEPEILTGVRAPSPPAPPAPSPPAPPAPARPGDYGDSGMRESQSIGEDEASFDFSRRPSPVAGSFLTRYFGVSTAEEMRTWRIGLRFAALIAVMALIALFLIIRANSVSISPVSHLAPHDADAQAAIHQQGMRIHVA